MSTPALGMPISYHAVLTNFAMQFGVVPNGVENGVVNFGSIREPQAKLQPLINTDGTLEDRLLIAGFPRVETVADIESCNFLRDWFQITAMLDVPVRTLVYGPDIDAKGSEQRLPSGVAPSDDSIWDEMAGEGAARGPDLGPFEILTVRQVLEMFTEGASPVSKMKEIGDHLYLKGGDEVPKSLAANLYFASGVLFLKTGNKEKAMQSFEVSSANLPDDYESGRAILYEMAADAMGTDVGRKSVAKQWLRALTADPDARTEDIKLFRAMWNAWRAYDLSMMRDLMNAYMSSRRGQKDLLETAKACVRISWLTSEAVEKDGGKGSSAGERGSSRTQLEIASSLFRRAGDEGNADRAARIADIVES